MMIDNKTNFDDLSNVMVCPTYNHTYVENLPAMIDEAMFDRYKYQICKKLKYTPSNYIQFQKAFYTSYIDALDKYMPPQDRFWFFLSRLLEIKNITVFTKKNIQYINHKLSKRLTQT